MVGMCEAMCPTDEIKLYVLLLTFFIILLYNMCYKSQANQREIVALLRTKIIASRRIHCG